MKAVVMERIGSKMRAVGVCSKFLLFVPTLWASFNLRAQSYPTVEPIRRTFMVADLASANVSLDIKSARGSAIYHLQCHSGSYAGDPDFVYSGDFECRLSSIGLPDLYSTLLTEDARQSKDWESRGRFFAAQLRGSCARIPEFGANRSFKLRGMDLGLRVSAPTFTEAGKLTSFRLTVTVHPNPVARRAIATIVPLPPVGTVPESCEIWKDFVD